MAGDTFKYMRIAFDFSRIRHPPSKIKVGHAGTLDPLATGLLIICTGKMTKRIDEFSGLNKTYTGKITIGSTTPSYDLETKPNVFYPTDHIDENLIIETAKKFVGKIDQKPPDALFSPLVP